MVEIPILLLAAGASRRMGQAKQLLPWGKSTLIEHQVQTLLRTAKPVLVVVGHLSERILPLLEAYPVRILEYKHWERGMGSSISFGIGELERRFPKADGVLITHLDQALLTESHINEMLSIFQPKSAQIVVSCSSSGWEGVPVLFDRVYFESLQLLGGEEGARKIFRQHPRQIVRIESSDLLEDMDTPEAYQRLLSISREKK